MSKKPIKSNLFRFVTLRSPQLIEDKEIGFVSFPEGQSLNNKALTAVSGATTVAARKIALKGAYNTGFTPVAGRKGIRNEHKHLYEFTSWLMRNKSYLSYASIEANLFGANVLSLEEELVVWDNLFYQTIHKKSISVRERLIQLLITNQFLKAFIAFRDSFSSEQGGEIVFTDENEKEFVRRANASVIVPKEVIISTQQQLKKAVAKPSLEASNYMQANLEVALAKDRIRQQEASLKEIAQAEVAYKKAEKLRYDAALKIYETTIDQIQQDAVPEVQTIVDSKTGFQKRSKTYPELQLPKFEFEKETELVKGEGTVFSAKTLELLNSDELKVYDTFSEVKTALKSNVKKEYQLVYQKTPQDIKEVAVRGAKIPVDPMKGGQLYSFTGMVMPFRVGNKSAMSMSLNAGYANASVTDVTYELKKTDGTLVASGTEVRVFTGSGNLVNLSFFSDGENLTSGMRVFSGKLTLSNGVALEFNAALFVDALDNSRSTEGRDFMGSYSGVATKVVASEGDANTGGDISTGDVLEDAGDGVLYGISQLGIADFRRVEQEVCCYVPGEVSHIENIMAREYKERSTRNLTSAEQTTEKNSEKEVENLTDTSSTERNELQSETSSILNSDNATSFGANASVSGGKFGITFSAGVNFNSSSSNSASNSNSEAQTYAQEVTERALERVVQKVSTKRTSRILKEFEENNTHGFDNRKGDTHVTGVYRWVDKIYKNKLINYGKRLMYEFALPEPAKFFIKSYLENDHEDKKTNVGLIVPKKPIHPSKLKVSRFNVNGDEEGEGIVASSDINEGNYQYVSSIYGVEAKSIIERYNFTGTSFTKSSQGGDGDKWNGKASKDSIRIPKGYKAVQVKTSGAKHYEGVVRVTVGGLNMTLNSEYFQGIHPHYLSDIPVSVHFDGVWLGNVNVVVKCERTEEAYEQWQNETYKAIIDAYDERLRDYNEFVLKQVIEGEEDENKKELSSQINRGIEKRELKRIAIDLIAKAHSVEVSRDNYRDDKGIISNKYVARSSDFDEHARTVKFFEQAFDWEIMAYTFYPYFYGAEGNWDANFDYNEGSDPIFQAFLQSGMARSVVPVRPGFEEAVNWYMKTGEIWNGQGMVTDTDDDLYVSVAEEMQTIEGEVEGTWETRVPTSLTVLQADSVALNEGGLPCNPDCGEGGMFDSVKTSPDGVDFDIVGQNNNVA
ncbi:hypothetical protein PG911_18630 [Tenacibaculum ovolyticum]|uniref:hypothetical protein n=1 Tax=Tenacibaculum ovolyticum TaxID=104270 RepID=UPI0022F3BD13|nr:hypothetical protein [Tenacibaculum ovolyticum]WBX76603.1 hypothetical protein PG911_18630 [Tenacibaculum ovolyticum]